MKSSTLTTLLILCPLLHQPSVSPAGFEIPETLSAEQAARFKPFESFYIKGVCEEGDHERLESFGVNTVRGYTIRNADEMLPILDELHARGMKMIVSEWLPHHGENKGSNGITWDFDYDKEGDQLITDLLARVDAIGDHPAILMWGLGNEVHLDEPYLRTINRMSLEIHKRFPHHLTSLTIINAEQWKLEKIQEFAPDIDVLGLQSYSAGAVRSGIRNAETYWKKPFYYSEFNGKGPWNFKKTEWGTELDELTPSKLGDLKQAYDAIEASNLCLGSTVFVWGYFTVNRPTYFSLLLAEDPATYNESTPKSDLLITPRAEHLAERFTGKPFSGNRAPLLTQLAFSNGEKFSTAKSGKNIRLRVKSDDPDGDDVFYKAWFLDTETRKPAVVSGPHEFKGSSGKLKAPSEPGSYLIMVYALDGNGGASASTLPLLVE